MTGVRFRSVPRLSEQVFGVNDPGKRYAATVDMSRTGRAGKAAPTSGSPPERERRELVVDGVRAAEPALEQADPFDRERDRLQRQVEQDRARRFHARERDVRRERARF